MFIVRCYILSTPSLYKNQNMSQFILINKINPRTPRPNEKLSAHIDISQKFAFWG